MSRNIDKENDKMIFLRGKCKGRQETILIPQNLLEIIYKMEKEIKSLQFKLQNQRKLIFDFVRNSNNPSIQNLLKDKGQMRSKL